MVPFLTWKEQDTAPELWRRKSTKFTYSCRSSWLRSTIASRRLLRQWPPRRLRSQVLSKLLGACWLALPPWKQVQPLALAAPTRQDLGTYLDRLTTPQLLGLSGDVAQGHLMTMEIRDVGLILYQVLKMNMREVPSYYGSRVNSPTYQTVTNLSEYIAKQVPCRSDSYSKQKPNVRTLCPDIRMMVSTLRLIVHFDKAEP